jgi:AraC-like DNA-binding protein
MSKVDSISRYETIPPQAKDFPVSIKLHGSSGKPTPHWHEHLELLYFTKGSCDVIVDGKFHSAEAGDLVIVNGGQIHSFVDNRDGAEYFCVLIYPDFFRDIDFRDTHLASFIPGDPFVKECMDQMYKEATESKVGSDMIVKSVAYRLIAHLERSYAVEHPSEQEQARRQATLSRLNTVLDYVAKNYNRPLSTRDLAAILYVSEGYFCRFFKAATGKGAVEYINEYRIKRAAALLENTDLPLAEIAATVGFEDANYFSRAFRKLKGESPSEYRKKAREIK